MIFIFHFHDAVTMPLISYYYATPLSLLFSRHFLLFISFLSLLIDFLIAFSLIAISRRLLRSARYNDATRRFRFLITLSDISSSISPLSMPLRALWRERSASAQQSAMLRAQKHAEICGSPLSQRHADDFLR